MCEGDATGVDDDAVLTAVDASFVNDVLAVPPPMQLNRSHTLSIRLFPDTPPRMRDVPAIMVGGG